MPSCCHDTDPAQYLGASQCCVSPFAWLAHWSTASWNQCGISGRYTYYAMYACCPLSFWELYSNHGIIYAELMGASMSVWIVSYVAVFLAWLRTWLSYHYAIIIINWVRHSTPHQQHWVTVILGCTYVSAAYSACCSLQWMPFVYTPPLPLLHVLALQLDSLGSIEYDIAVLHMNGVGLKTLQSQWTKEQLYYRLHNDIDECGIEHSKPVMYCMYCMYVCQCISNMQHPNNALCNTSANTPLVKHWSCPTPTVSHNVTHSG